jgi:hypothetical protein
MICDRPEQASARAVGTLRRTVGDEDLSDSAEAGRKRGRR